MNMRFRHYFAFLKKALCKNAARVVTPNLKSVEHGLAYVCNYRVEFLPTLFLKSDYKPLIAQCVYVLLLEANLKPSLCIAFKHLRRVSSTAKIRCLLFL